MSENMNHAEPESLVKVRLECCSRINQREKARGWRGGGGKIARQNNPK